MLFSRIFKYTKKFSLILDFEMVQTSSLGDFLKVNTSILNIHSFKVNFNHQCMTKTWIEILNFTYILPFLVKMP